LQLTRHRIAFAIRSTTLAICMVVAGPVTAMAADPAVPTLTIDASRSAGTVTPRLYGLMTEEINHSYDGGLYAELIQNRAFMDDAWTPRHWTVVQGEGSGATIALDRDRPRTEQTPTSLRLDVTAASGGHPAGVANDGYWGIPVRSETRYTATFYARTNTGFSGSVTLAIKSEDGQTVYAKAQVARLTDQWQSYTATLRTGTLVPTAKARFVLTVDRPGTVWLGYVSLFPPTWKNRPNGLRPDLMQALVDMKPGFLRFPGGNYLEGNKISERFDWKKTLGPPEDRPGHWCPWGYRSTDGMGLLEFLYWCEDMGAEPLLAVYAGYSLNGEHVNAGPALVPYVQEALDEIEYVIGDKNTKWGAVRIRDGHSKPFPLHYVEIGNEDNFDKSGSYDGRFAQFHDAIKAKYPQLKVISSAGKEYVPSRKPDVVDEHNYSSAAGFEGWLSTHYEGYDRKSSPEIFVGEWAAFEDTAPWDSRSHSLPATPSMKAALGDAAWMTEMERNANLVVMQCYAPLLANVNPGGWQWRPNMIGYDALTTYGSPSYYAFQMFSCNHGDVVLKAALTDRALHTSVTRDSTSGTITVKLVNPQATPQPVKIDIPAVTSLTPIMKAITLAADPVDTNAIDMPIKVVPVTTEVPNFQPGSIYTLPANSITVLEMKP
jgi:alpha-N-arabinofuranosidase